MIPSEKCIPEVLLRNNRAKAEKVPCRESGFLPTEEIQTTLCQRVVAILEEKRKNMLLTRSSLGMR